MAIATPTAPESKTSQVAPAAPALVPVTPSDRLYRLSVEQYDEMARLGILKADERIELIEGLLVEKMTKGDSHISTVWLIHYTFIRTLPAGWFSGKEDPIVLVRSEPEPDVTILKGGIPDYQGRKPTAADVALTVEVADTSYAADRAKRAIYAEAGIPYYWIVNLPALRIEVYAEPTGPDPSPDYRSRRDFGPADAVPLVLEGREVARLAVRDLLSPEPSPNK